MEWIAENLTLVLAVVGVAIVVLGLVRKLIRLAITGVVLAVIGVVLYGLLA